ncbi:MAG: hypothetical protein OQK11_05990 [Thiovulaceae bacterium]|nr:hypothetical protein [Sulfurimonadaceae bacterium]
MYESQIVEVEDFNFCHYINHFDEYEQNYPTYDEMFEFDGVVVENADEEYSEL